MYKLIGPMLAKQDVLEATTNVTKRLEYINMYKYVCTRTKIRTVRR